MNSPVKYSLIVSTGNSDIKLWVQLFSKDQKLEKYGSAELAPRGSKGLSVRTLHRKLVDRQLPYIVVNDQDARKRFAVEYDQEKMSVCVTSTETGDLVIDENKGEKNNTLRLCWETSEDRSLMLRPAKMGRIIARLHELHTAGEIELVGGLFLNTYRNESQHSEPIGAHILLARWCGELFEKEVAPLTDPPAKDAAFFYANYTSDLLSGDDKLEGKGVDYPIKRVVARRIDEIIKLFLQVVPDNSLAIISTTGGPQDPKRVITASVRFRSKGNCIEINDTEYQEDFGTRSDAQAFLKNAYLHHHLHPAMSLEMRSLVASRIRQGDFAGAWGICAHLKNVEPEWQWAQAVHWLYNYFINHHSEFNFQLNDTPCAMKESLTRFHRHLLSLTSYSDDILSQIRNTLTFTCFRIEAALTTVNVSDVLADIRLEDALIATYAFGDQLFRAEIWKFLNENMGSISFDEENLLYICSAKKSITKFPLKKGKYVDLISEKLKVNYRSEKERNAWSEYLAQNNILFSASFRNRLQKFCDSTTSVSSQTISLNQIRNKLAHHSLSRTNRSQALQVSGASASAEGESIHPLWNPGVSSGSVAIGDAFLSQYWVKKTNEYFNFDTSLQESYRDLIQSLLDILELPQSV